MESLLLAEAKNGTTSVSDRSRQAPQISLCQTRFVDLFSPVWLVLFALSEGCISVGDETDQELALEVMLFGGEMVSS